MYTGCGHQLIILIQFKILTSIFLVKLKFWTTATDILDGDKLLRISLLWYQTRNCSWLLVCGQTGIDPGAGWGGQPSTMSFTAS